MKKTLQGDRGYWEVLGGLARARSEGVFISVNVGEHPRVYMGEVCVRAYM